MIKNITRKTIISNDFKICKSMFSKMIGLMFSFKPKTLVFEFSSDVFVPLHMWFVFFPIDVIYLNKEREVVEIKENFKPFSYYHPKKVSKFVIELTSGAIKKSKTRLGDKIGF